MWERVEVKHTEKKRLKNAERMLYVELQLSKSTPPGNHTLSSELRAHIPLWPHNQSTFAFFFCDKHQDQNNLRKGLICLKVSHANPTSAKVGARTWGRSLMQKPGAPVLYWLASRLLLYRHLSHVTRAHLPTDSISHNGLALLRQLAAKEGPYRHIWPPVWVKTVEVPFSRWVKLTTKGRHQFTQVMWNLLQRHCG